MHAGAEAGRSNETLSMIRHALKQRDFEHVAEVFVYFESELVF
jgi:hypothetical protein